MRKPSLHTVLVRRHVLVLVTRCQCDRRGSNCQLGSEEFGEGFAEGLGKGFEGRLPGSAMVPTVQHPRKVVVGCTDHISLSSGITMQPKLIVYAVFTLYLY